MKSNSSFLLAVIAVFVQLLSYCILTSLGQACQSATEDGSGDCRVLNRDASCKVEHLEQDLEYCSILIPVDDLYERIDELYAKHVYIEDCGNRHSITEENAAVLRSNKIELMPIEIYSVDVTTFSLNISWHHAINFTMRYTITISTADFEFLYFSCNSNGSIHIFEYEFLYNDVEEDITVNIVPELDIFKSTSGSVTWPATCLDADFYDSSSCGPPVLNPPHNISVAEVCDAITDNLTFIVSWDFEIKQLTSPPDYYIEVYSEKTESNFIPLYRFLANGTKSVSIQLPHHLNYSIELRAFSNCSGIANYSSEILEIGCGIKSDPMLLKLCPPPPTTTNLQTELSTTSSSKSSTPKTPTTNFLPHIIAGCVATLLIIIIIIVIFISLLVRKNKRKKPKMIIHNLPPVDFSVLLMHSPQDNSMKDIQTYMVCPLQRFFDVATSGDKLCGDLIEWIELQVRQRTAVLLVFTKEFCSEWEGEEDKSHVVQAAQRLLTSAVAQELLDKYAIVVLDEEAKENFIPDNHFLKSMSVYVLGRKKSEIESLYRFVTKSKSIEHEARPSSSFGSSVSTNDFTSQCTLSTGVSSVHDLTSKDPTHQGISNVHKTDSLPDETSSQPNLEVRLNEALLETLRSPIPSPTSDGEMV